MSDSRLDLDRMEETVDSYALEVRVLRSELAKQRERADKNYADWERRRNESEALRVRLAAATGLLERVSDNRALGGSQLSVDVRSFLGHTPPSPATATAEPQEEEKDE